MSDNSNRDVISQVAEQFTRTFWRMRRGAAKELAPMGLTFSQARALRVLGKSEYAMRIGELAARLDIVPRSATATVDLLEEAGLAAREADPTDRRSVRVALTPEGRGLLDRMGEARRASAEEFFGRLDADELAQLRGLLDAMNAGDEPESRES